MGTFSDDDIIGKALEECELIDKTLPNALPLYINKEWASPLVREYYKLKLADAGALKDVIDKVTENPDTGPLEIEF